MGNIRAEQDNREAQKLTCKAIQTKIHFNHRQPKHDSIQSLSNKMIPLNKEMMGEDRMVKKMNAFLFLHEFSKHE